MTWPAPAVSDAEHGSRSGLASLPSVPDFDALVTALHAQAKAVERLAGSVAALAAAVADALDDDDQDVPRQTYLDGSPR